MKTAIDISSFIKHEYITPMIRVVRIQHQTALMQSSVTNNNNNAGLDDTIGPGNGNSRAPYFGGEWEEWDEEE